VLVHNGKPCDGLGDGVKKTTPRYQNAPTLPPHTIVEQKGVRIYRHLDEHRPPHVHVTGKGPDTKIGANGKPIEGFPDLSGTQKQVVKENLSIIRSAVNKIRKWFNFMDGI